MCYEVELSRNFLKIRITSIIWFGRYVIWFGSPRRQYVYVQNDVKQKQV